MQGLTNTSKFAPLRCAGPPFRSAFYVGVKHNFNMNSNEEELQRLYSSASDFFKALVFLNLGFITMVGFSIFIFSSSDSAKYFSMFFVFEILFFYTSLYTSIYLSCIKR